MKIKSSDAAGIFSNIKLSITATAILSVFALSTINANAETKASDKAGSETKLQKNKSGTADAQLKAAIDGKWRSNENRARDVYRHPFETLSFFGVQPNSTVIELIPSGGAWYGEILAPYLRNAGHYIAANAEGNPEDEGQAKKFAADPARFSKVKVLTFKGGAPNFGADNSADMFLTFRNVHSFAVDDKHVKLFEAIFKVLKKGGVFGVVDHRAADSMSHDDALKRGYISEEFVIREAEKAGFKLAARSPINNNAKDTKDYPNGVWSLPPSCAERAKDLEKYAAIGESDRFTLRFVKP